MEDEHVPFKSPRVFKCPLPDPTALLRGKGATCGRFFKEWGSPPIL